MQQLMMIVLNGPQLSESAECEEIIELALTYWACRQKRNIIIPGARTSLNLQWAATLDDILWGEIVSKEMIAEEVALHKTDNVTGVRDRILTSCLNGVAPEPARRLRQERVVSLIRTAADLDSDEENDEAGAAARVLLDTLAAEQANRMGGRGKRVKFTPVPFDVHYGDAGATHGTCPSRVAQEPVSH